jgi:acetyl-CoA carboxylase, biotin carboxylase subunit
MFEKVLIANRGEIAVRIIRACKELGLRTVAVFSKADRESLHVKLADEAFCIGNNASAESYLNIPNIISVAEITDAEAIHPGYGFLSESADFAEICESCRITFIGPKAGSINLMGNKSLARETARKAGVTVVPGSRELVKDKDDALKLAHKIGYPVIVKASAGGGGRGMRVAHTDVSLVNGYLAAQAESEISFGSSDVYIEKFLDNPRHIEVQVLADSHGNTIHLGERDCSMQRRHQKLIEESPSPVVEDKLRDEMCDMAVKLSKYSNYESAGTVEFLLDRDSRFYFIEMNTRIQVEHTVTEMITGMDIIKEQIRIAAGERLEIKQKDVNFSGVALECRINAEDPDNDFRPCPGKIDFVNIPGGPHVRVDSYIYSGYEVPAHYDSMLAKVITHGQDRREAIACMVRALDEFIIEGVKTTIPLLLRLIQGGRFINGDYGINFLDELFE